MVLLYAVPMMFLFVTLSDQWTLDGFLVGYAVGVIVGLLIGVPAGQLRLRRLPGQVFWLLVYIARLCWDILLSSVDVARRVLDPRLPINPGQVTISSRVPSDNRLISALSAHAITVTPGEMVENFVDAEGETRMIVHTLDVEATRRNGDRQQAQRLVMLRRITGDDES